MAADVAERAQLAVVAADDERRLGADLDGDEAAGVGQVGDVPGELPAAGEDRRLLAGHAVRVDVEPGVQRGGLGLFDRGHLTS
jgi:hypothetical protein